MASMEPTAAAPASPGRRIGIPLGRVFGFPLSIRWSVLLLVGLVTLLSGELLGYGVGFGFVVSLLASVLLHELGHAVIARQLGIGVRGITLGLLGGYTELDGDPPRPKAELLVSLAGPAVSLLLGVGALAAAVVLPEGGVSQVAWLVALANLIVAVFNVLPGLPLDGGRALRSAVWAVSGSRRRGTIVAARGGQVVAVATLVTAVSLFLGDRFSLVGLLLLTLVALDLWRGAAVSLRLAWLSGRARLVEVDRLARPIFAVVSGTPLAEAQRQAVESAPPAAALAVSDSSGRLVALVHPEAAEAVPVARRPWVSVDSVARGLAGIRTVPAGVRGLDALRMLQGDPAGEVVVTDGDKVVGVLRAGDVDRLLRTMDTPEADR